MGLIIKRLTLIGRKAERKASVLFDTGASFSLIRADLAKELGEPEELNEPKRFQAAVGRFTARFGLFADVRLQGNRLPATFYVAHDLTEDAILGVDFFQVWHIRLDPRTRRVRLDPRCLRLRAGGGRYSPR